MAGLLSGLSSLGLGNLEKMDVFEEKAEKQKQQEAQEQQKAEIKEEDLIFDKKYQCPCCDEEFMAKTVRVGKAKHISSDMDLRPKYEGVDMLKYDAVMCPFCGFSALTRYFKPLPIAQMKLIRENICSSFKMKLDHNNAIVYTYEQALERYQMCLANAIVKRAKASERAYICLKGGWLVRGMGEALDQSAADYESRKKECDDMENEYLQNAMEGFITARQSEAFPMCGMDEATVDYLISVLAIRFEKYDIASKLIGSMIVSKGINPRMRDKARDLKEVLKEKMKG